MLLTGTSPATRPLCFFGGKGGVGKTTLAAAYGVLLAGRGIRTLVVSTDPAHSLADVLATPLGDEPAHLGDQLWACEIDGERAARRRVEQVTKEAEQAVPREVMPAVERHLHRAATSPGTVESALMDRLAELLDQLPHRWDRIVVDSAPTGHMVRLLSLPALLTPWIEGLARQREQARGTERLVSGMLGRPQADDPLLARLHQRRERLDATRSRLVQETLVHLVLVPERLPAAETERAARHLTDEGLTLGEVIVNRVTPPGTEGPLAERVGAESAALSRIRENLGHLGLIEVALQPGEPIGRRALTDLGDVLAAAGW